MGTAKRVTHKAMLREYFTTTPIEEVVKYRMDELVSRFGASRYVILGVFRQVYGMTFSDARRVAIARVVAEMMEQKFTYSEIQEELSQNWGLTYDSGWTYIRMVKNKGLDGVLKRGWGNEKG